MTQAGEVSVESAPYRKDLDVDETCPLSAEPVCSVQPSDEEEVKGDTEVKGESLEEEKETVEREETHKKEEKEKKHHGHVTFGEGGEVKLRRNTPSRSQTMCNRPPRRSVDLRRQSLCMLKKGETGEMGSSNFRKALRRDSMHEIHPGWESIRKLSKVVG